MTISNAINTTTPIRPRYRTEPPHTSPAAALYGHRDWTRRTSCPSCGEWLGGEVICGECGQELGR